MFATTLRYGCKSGAEFYALDGIDAHQSVCNIRTKFVENRFAEAWRHTAGQHTDLGADRIALLA